MGLGHSPRIVTDGMVLYLDAANPKNYNLTEVEVLVVAGGGGGGGSTAGGGGAGGVIYNRNFAVTPGSALTVTVGSGGQGTVRSSLGAPTNTSGGNSVFGALTAIGGGKGYSGSDTFTPGSSAVGGSGGGGGYYSGGLDPKGSGTSSAGTAGQGFAGGDGAAITEWGGGGGGGAGGPGGAQVADNTLRTGGPGLGFNISGTFQYYGGGGGGGAYLSGFSLGGIGGGGNGGDGQTYTSTAGTTNTGGGGGGGGYYQFGPGGAAGGSGIVIVRYPGPQKAIGGTITSNNGYTIHTFTTVGSTTFTPLVATNNSAVLGLSDLSGRGNFGTTANSPTYSSANGGSLSFDGTNDYVTCGNILNFTTENFSFNIFFYLTSTTTNSVGQGPILFYKGAFNSNGYYIQLTQNNPSQATFITNQSGVNQITISSLSIVVGAWNNISVTRSGSSVRIYINGVDATSSAATHINPASSTDNFQLAAYSTGIFANTRIASFQAYNRALSAAEVSQNYNALKSRFIPDGSSAEKAAPSASYLVSLGLTADGVYWINLPTAGPTQVYCILNPAYDGGGWMMAMKATTGTTFNYSANYWTTANTLNPTETNRNNGDAKFNSMNYFQSKDMMAIWPDISNGGSIPSSTLGWTWLQNNFNDGTRITPISFFGITYPTMNTGGSGKFIQDAKTFSGWASGVFSSQVDIRFYGFNYINNPNYGTQVKVRWGFGWNENGEGLYPSSGGGAPGSNDVTGGIGLDTGGGSYSAGDRINCCQDTIGINRSARVEVYVR
jgi:hypothetical protein